MEEIKTFELTREFADSLKTAIERGDNDFILQSLEGVNPADITETLEEFTTDESRYILTLLDTQIGADIISNLEEDTLKKFLRVFTPKEIAAYIDLIDSDDAADILNELPIKIREEVISSLSNDEKAEHIVDLMRYDEDVAGGIMAKELIKANLNWTVEQTTEEIRNQAENISKIFSVYVVDDRNRLLGRVSLKKMLLARKGTLIKDIYDDDVIAIKTYDDAEEVIAAMKKYDLEAIPVVNMQNNLMGRVTIDDVVDVMTEQAEEERQLMAGISEDVEEDDSIWMQTRARIPWLIIGLIGAFFGAEVIGLFESDIAAIPIMAAFIPLITATAGNVAIQSSSIVVQSLANKSVFQDSTAKRLAKVVIVALINGLLLAILAFAISYFRRGDLTISLIVAIALSCVVLLASLSGTITPIVLDKLDINPAAASGPFITTFNDILGLAVYFAVAYILFQ
ncbi:Mg/Co/Ni transporter MgtE, CBS domain-containing [hydrothermal vent metagenome]|uniref:Mg/Co/Ni transporter MgtE, CBS domain-containing n=1 Tax=hydrothermal vent metagenome TaxID=652676 RepID=A0A3B0UQB3_9ZZZZ